MQSSNPHIRLPSPPSSAQPILPPSPPVLLIAKWIGERAEEQVVDPPPAVSRVATAPPPSESHPPPASGKWHRYALVESPNVPLVVGTAITVLALGKAAVLNGKTGRERRAFYDPHVCGQISSFSHAIDDNGSPIILLEVVNDCRRSSVRRATIVTGGTSKWRTEFTSIWMREGRSMIVAAARIALARDFGGDKGTCRGSECEVPIWIRLIESERAKREQGGTPPPGDLRKLAAPTQLDTWEEWAARPAKSRTELGPRRRKEMNIVDRFRG